jgi:hypothetical protein
MQSMVLLASWANAKFGAPIILGLLFTYVGASRSSRDHASDIQLKTSQRQVRPRLDTLPFSSLADTLLGHVGVGQSHVSTCCDSARAAVKTYGTFQVITPARGPH